MGDILSTSRGEPGEAWVREHLVWGEAPGERGLSVRRIASRGKAADVDVGQACSWLLVHHDEVRSLQFHHGTCGVQRASSASHHVGPCHMPHAACFSLNVSP